MTQAQATVTPMMAANVEEIIRGGHPPRMLQPMACSEVKEHPLYLRLYCTYSRSLQCSTAGYSLPRLVSTTRSQAWATRPALCIQCGSYQLTRG
jgi:hypothetical protein